MVEKALNSNQSFPQSMQVEEIEKLQSVPNLAFHSVPSQRIFEILHSSSSGLSSDEAKKRLNIVGLNQLPIATPPSFLTVFMRQFLNPLIYVLLFVAIVSVVMAHASDSIFIFGILLINAVIGATQEHSAEKSSLALRQVARTRARVRRDGQDREISSEQLVPGDIILLESGDKVPADLRLMTASSLSIDESLLTGESYAVTKDSTTELSSEVALGDRVNSAFAGTLVTHGRGLGIVISTADRTELGRIAESVQGRASIKTPLLIRMERFSRWIAIGTGFVIITLSMILFAQGSPLIEVFLLAVALAVSAIPEGLPIALTVALSIASRRMARRNVIVRRLAAVEALGSCTYIGTDKTGTLTVNELTARLIQFPEFKPWEVSSLDSSAQEAVVIPSEINRGFARHIIQQLCQTAILCNEGTLRIEDGKVISHGDAVDIALLSLANKFNIIQDTIRSQFTKIAEIPFESEQKFAGTLHTGNDKVVVSVKGAVERILPMCSQMLGQDQVIPCQQSQIEKQSHHLAGRGYRILALASKELPAGSIHTLNEAFLHDLTFLGLIGMIDPLRPEAKDAIRFSREAGIQVSMITGDHPVTALAIARELDLASSMEEVVTGSALKKAEKTQSTFDQLTKAAKVFARVEPKQKLQIVESIIRQGHFVAVTGDGANDAPALKAAHVGVAMGRCGTDVAREAADLILADDRFSSIVGGIEEGRIAYANVRKVIYLLIATGAAEVLLFLMCTIAGLPSPLTPVQLLWLNVITNGIQDVALAFEPREGDELKQKPRSPNESIFNRIMLERVFLSATIIGGISFFYYYHLIQHGMSHFSAQNLILLQMVLFENIMIGNARSETKPFYKLNPFRNPLLFYGTIAAQGIHIAAMHTPGLQKVLGVAPVTLPQWMTSFLLALSVFAVGELHKWVKRTS